jgi:hypothetical protein
MTKGGALANPEGDLTVRPRAPFFQEQIDPGDHLCPNFDISPASRHSIT